jgi:hypothetical protein
MMRNLFLLAITAVMLVALSVPADASVTWDFYETGITACEAFACVQPAGPQFLMSLSLSGPTETGSAEYAFGGTPAVTDPDFTFELDASFSYIIAPPSFDSYPPGYIQGYDITWDAASGQLDGVSVDFLSAVSDDVGYYVGGFGLTGGGIGSDGSFGGCSDGSCTVAGYWRNAAAVREPGSAVLLTSALVVFGLARFRRRRPSLLGP